MKKLILILTVAGSWNGSFAQDRAAADKLVDEGVAFHDKRDYNGAIARYDKALELDKNNLLALTEKAYSLLNLQKYDEAIVNCKKAIELHPGEKTLRTVYVTYGTALDALKKTDNALKIYDEGIRLFPAFYLLQYNKGITLLGMKNYEEGAGCFKKAVRLNPQHASSHNALARISMARESRIPSILAFCRFLSIEQKSPRAAENLMMLKSLVAKNVEKTGKKSVSVNISPGLLDDTTSDGKRKEDHFGATDMILTMEGALDFDKKYAKQTEVEQFIRKFETVCASLKETKEGNHGFFWDYYVPYFTEMKDRNMVQAFAYISYSSAGDSAATSWVQSHKTEVDEFFKWSQSFKWNGQL